MVDGRAFFGLSVDLSHLDLRIDLQNGTKQMATINFQEHLTW